MADTSPRAGRPNVLVVLADQWRGTDQGWRGNHEVLTPHLDRLAVSGVAVPGAYANAPVCCPSRASLLTGQLPHRHRVVANDLPLPDGIPTIADALSDCGYRTGWIGKWHLDGLPRDKFVPPERRRGFAYWAGTNCTHDYFDGHYYTGADPTPVPFQGYEPEVQTELALRFLAEPDDRPFFLFMSYNPPHDPYEDVPARYLDRVDLGELSVRANAVDDPGQRTLLQQYYAGIAAIDDQVGRLTAALEELGQLSNTLVVVTSDHGDMLGSHGRWAKQVPHEESISVPLVLSWPDRLAPREIRDGVIGLVDLAPTLLGLVDAPALPGTYGRDLSDAIAGDGPLRDAVLLLNAVSCDAGHQQGVKEWRGVRTGALTYAREVDVGRPWLLFDNLHDPWQRRNLVGDDDSVLRMDRLLDRMLAEAGDPALPAESMLRAVDMVEAWNARELELHGDQARLVAPEGVLP